MVGRLCCFVPLLRVLPYLRSASLEGRSMKWPADLPKALTEGVFLTSCGWLSKLWSPFESPKYKVPYYTQDPEGTMTLTCFLGCC